MSVEQSEELSLNTRQPVVAQAIADTQSARDHRHLAIQHVGLKDIRYPLRLAGLPPPQPTAEVSALWSLGVALAAEHKGTHMSRLVAWLDELHRSAQAVDAPVLALWHQRLLGLLEAESARITGRFHFFVRKRAPVSGVESLLDYAGELHSRTVAGCTQVWQAVQVPVKALCPCSKEISDYGAHNQRSLVTVRVHTAVALPWLDLIRYAEEEASSEVWPLLKRVDEKWVTERAYDNPKFVEDLVRDVALRVQADARVLAWDIDVENLESIHNHSAHARISGAHSLA